MDQNNKYNIDRIDFTDDSYTVEQNLTRNKYEALDSNGETVLQGKQETFKLKEKFPFTNPSGEEVFTIDAQQVRDVAGDYVLSESKTGKEIVILDNDYSIIQDTWRIRDAETEDVLAEINSRKFVDLFRNGLLGNLIPHKYEITDGDGGHVGSISGQISMKDRYEIKIDNTINVPKEPIVAAAMVIDAIQEN
ncbi:hypothetical protein [Halosolutus gelatinilyticus]|uniref:hypothetical protein n=1 Tax=Halosolutus gelatinilyticus TaxID=2931975 RepID=UPI001FF50EB9|nr:hypothetical protein [Halosolutus gelatinilyticus]